MILRYNTETEKYTVHPDIYRTMDGLPGEIKPPFVQLEVIETAKEYDPETQNIELDYGIQINDEPHDLKGINGTATQNWIVTDKSEAEIARQSWKAQTNYRVIAPKSLLQDQQLMALMIVLRNLERFETETGFEIYFNEVDRDDEATFNYLKDNGIIQFEEYPK